MHAYSLVGVENSTHTRMFQARQTTATLNNFKHLYEMVVCYDRLCVLKNTYNIHLYIIVQQQFKCLDLTIIVLMFSVATTIEPVVGALMRRGGRGLIDKFQN